MPMNEKIPLKKPSERIPSIDLVMFRIR